MKLSKNEIIYRKALALQEAEEKEAEDTEDETPIVIVKQNSDHKPDADCYDIDGYCETGKFDVTVHVDITIGDRTFEDVIVNWDDEGNCYYMGGEGPSWGYAGGDPGYDRYRYYINSNDCIKEISFPENFDAGDEMGELEALVDKYDLSVEVAEETADAVDFEFDWED